MERILSCFERYCSKRQFKWEACETCSDRTTIARGNC